MRIGGNLWFLTLIIAIIEVSFTKISGYKVSKLHLRLKIRESQQGKCNKNKKTRTFECTHINTDSRFQLCSVNQIFYCSILPPNLASHSSIVGIVPSNFSG